MSDRPMISLDNCAGVRSLLPRFLDGESGPLEEQRIAAHLNSCHGCRVVHDQVRDEWRLTIHTLTGVSSDDVAALSQATLEQLRPQMHPVAQSTLKPSGDSRSSPPTLPFGRWWSSAAALLVAALLLSDILPPPTRAPLLEVPVTASMILVRGDVDSDGDLDMADFHELVGWLEKNGPQPRCLAAADFDDNGSVTIADSVLALAQLATSSAQQATLLYPRGSDNALPCLEVCP
ncbi:MAG: zf-HC2 domain-containing protein [Planctomycetota bacterium]|nr:zf-HC2 domain-containing protein [Planctomycetota bacterium]